MKCYDKSNFQKLVFPEGIVIDPVKRKYQTSKVNSIFKTIRVISRDKKDKTKNASSISSDASCKVAGVGFIFQYFVPKNGPEKGARLRKPQSQSDW